MVPCCPSCQLGRNRRLNDALEPLSECIFGRVLRSAVPRVLPDARVGCADYTPCWEAGHLAGLAVHKPEHRLAPRRVREHSPDLAEGLERRPFLSHRPFPLVTAMSPNLAATHPI